MADSNDSFFEALQDLELPSDGELRGAEGGEKRGRSSSPELNGEGDANPEKRAKTGEQGRLQSLGLILPENSAIGSDFVYSDNSGEFDLLTLLGDEQSGITCDLPYSDNGGEFDFSSLFELDNSAMLCDVSNSESVATDTHVNSASPPYKKLTVCLHASDEASEQSGNDTHLPPGHGARTRDSPRELSKAPEPVEQYQIPMQCDIAVSDLCTERDVVAPQTVETNSSVYCDNIAPDLEAFPSVMNGINDSQRETDLSVHGNNAAPDLGTLPGVVNELVDSQCGTDSFVHRGNSESDCGALPTSRESNSAFETGEDNGERYNADVDILLEALMNFQSNNQVGEGTSSGAEKEFTVTEKPGLRSVKFNTSETMFVINLNSQLRECLWSANLNVLTSAMQNVLDILNSRLNENDLVRIYIGQQNLETPIMLNLRPLREISVTDILETIESVLQSKDTLAFDETFEIHVAYIELPRGTGKDNPPKHERLSHLAKSLKGKTSVAVIQNKDKMCLARAIVVGRCKIEQNKEIFRNMCRPNRKTQTNAAKKLCEMAGVDPTQSAGIGDIPKFEKAIGRRICVISADHLNRVIYRGCAQTFENRHNIYVYFHHNHFDTILNVKGFFAKGYFCHACLVPYGKIGDHVCPNICSICCRSGCIVGSEVVCSDCNRTCKNADCYDAHRRERLDYNYKPCSSLCERKWKCDKCNRLIVKSRRKRHICGERFCGDCKVYYTDEHKCFIKSKPAPKPQSNYIFFDFETMQVDFIHTVNYCVAQRVCERCIGIEDITKACESCGQRQFVFEGESALDEFCNWLFSDIHRGYTAIAHNARSFDSHFILKFLMENAIQPQIIYNHTKIMKLEVKSYGILIIDSLNHLPIRLANLPKAFGIPSISKGTFPFYFNTPENQSYVGPIPPTRFYAVDTMSSTDRDEFLKWHASQQNAVFDFRKEIYNYTVADVDILRKSCLKFRKLILDLTRPAKSAGCTYTHGVDPFTQLTVASMCFSLFRHLYLKPNTLARVPAEGITADKFSKISILWLEWVMHQSQTEGNPVRIQHALNGGEKRFCRFKFDGYCEEATTSANGASPKLVKRVYSFLGCVFHGCPTCYRPETYNSILDCSMGDLHKKTLEREQKLRAMGFEYICKWECEFKREMKENPEIEKLKSREQRSRLNPRDAFMGGRTNASKLYHEVKDGEKIKYYDFCSLYPYVCKFGEFPIGHPEVITSDFKPPESYFGFAKVKILPPRGIEHPVLPFRANGKLTFPLCRTCCENEVYKCTHNDEERAFVGTFVTLELRHAVKTGYKVLETHEVYHFSERSKYDEESQSGGLFTPYVNKFLKIKQESSGFPSWIKSEQDKLDYVESYSEREGIHLDQGKIESNPGLRYISKLILNNFWGKFGQRQSLLQNTFVVDLAEFYEILFDESKVIENIRIITEEVILVECTSQRGFQRPCASSNVYIAAFTTAQARLRLLSVLEMLGDRVLYYDTDSVIFVSKDGQPEPPVGDFLGDLTSELEVGEYIVIFVSGGPKNYAFITNKGREVCKVRGFSLNYKNSQTINFDTVRRMVQNVHCVSCKCVPKKTHCKDCSPRMTISNNKICRSKEDVTVFNREEKKDYRLCYTKRVLLDDFSTVPYGY